ncbi:uncharacterized protein LOC128674428 [Plodia interpunctella]|uniref:uncharacterized protein LOC128674428 n=1 Tax=Plodia interpunctella TaxID=58824 RepID=UPI003101500F
MLRNIMVWRKTVEARKIIESNIRMDYVKEGILFPRGRDIDGRLLFIVYNKLYDKDQKDYEKIKRVILYWLKKIDREEEGDKKITLFFDMDGCGIGNVDMELIKFLRMVKDGSDRFALDLAAEALPSPQILPVIVHWRISGLDIDKSDDVVA